MNEKSNFGRNLLLVVGFIAVIAAIAGAVYGVLKYFEKKKTEEFMDYYFDDDADVDEVLEEAQADEEVLPEA